MRNIQEHLPKFIHVKLILIDNHSFYIIFSQFIHFTFLYQKI